MFIIKDEFYINDKFFQAYENGMIHYSRKIENAFKFKTEADAKKIIDNHISKTVHYMVDAKETIKVQSV